ncbi:hypothetical protein AD950_00495 [Gluconobacter oxydans]|nr:hypothetical protein AD950_00495 [Gluconobacter oxydans]
MKFLYADLGLNEQALMILDGHFHSATLRPGAERGTTGFAAVRISQSLVQVQAEYFTIHSPGKCLKLIAKPAQTGKTLFNINET